jgi:hypothetical protein
MGQALVYGRNDSKFGQMELGRRRSSSQHPQSFCRCIDFQVTVSHK